MSSTGSVIARAAGTTVITAAAVCCGGSDSSIVTVRDPAVASVQVSPASASITEGGSQQLTATAYDASGSAISDVGISWSSSDAGVASVSSGGMVSAIAAGSAAITATTSGVRDTANITVTASSGGSGGGGNGATPDFVEDFSTYTSTATMLSDPRGIYSGSEDFYNNTSIGGGSSNSGAGTIELDTSDGYGSLSQSMKYTWFSYGSPGSGGSLGRALEWGRYAPEAWIEVAFKFSSNFRIDFGYSGGTDYKWIFGSGPVLGHGWTLTFEGGSLSQYYADNSGGTGEHPSPYNNHWSLSDLADGQWHVLRMHVKRTSPVVFDVLVDGVRNRAPLTNWSSSAAGIYGLLLGRNINQRPVNNVQTLKYGHIKVWYEGNDPGW